MLSRLFRRVWKLLLDKRVKFSTKIIYVLTVLIYGFAPDILPFLPFDDLFVLWFASNVFVNVAAREAGIQGKMYQFQNKRDDDVIDTEGEIIE